LANKVHHVIKNSQTNQCVQPDSLFYIILKFWL